MCNVNASQLLVGLVSSYRYDREVVDSVVANSEASRLDEAIKAKQLDHDHVIWILSTRNAHQLRATFECYKRNYGNPIEKVLASRIFSCFYFARFLNAKNH